jgi:hypothetical protein
MGAELTMTWWYYQIEIVCIAESIAILEDVAPFLCCEIQSAIHVTKHLDSLEKGWRE